LKRIGSHRDLIRSGRFMRRRTDRDIEGVGTTPGDGVARACRARELKDAISENGVSRALGTGAGGVGGRTTSAGSRTTNPVTRFAQMIDASEHGFKRTFAAFAIGLLRCSVCKA
jgi:hypothetical protein